MHTLGTYERGAYARADASQRTRRDSAGGAGSVPGLVLINVPNIIDTAEDYSSLQSGLESVLAIASCGDGCGTGMHQLPGAGVPADGSRSWGSC